MLTLSWFVAHFFMNLAVARGQNNETNAPIIAYHDRGVGYVAPEEWGTIWPMCQTPNQSPIDLEVPATNLHFAKDDLPLILELNSCHNIYDADVDELDTSPKWAFVENNCYAYGVNVVAHQIFHCDIHTPAEHTIDGVRYGAEFHIGWQHLDRSNKQKNGTASLPKVLVIGFIFQGQEDAEQHPFLTKLMNVQYNGTTKDNPVDLGQDWAAMLGLRSNTTQHDVTFFNYIGSGDVPPCLNGIDWWIVDTPIRVAQSQINEIRTYIAETMPQTDNGNNARPIQSRDGRDIRTGDNDSNSTTGEDNSSDGRNGITSTSWTTQLTALLAVSFLHVLFPFY